MIPDDLDNEISPEGTKPESSSSTTTTTSKPTKPTPSPADYGVDLSSISLFFDLLNLKLNMTRHFLGSVRDNLLSHIEDYFSAFHAKIDEHTRNQTEARKNGTGVTTSLEVQKRFEAKRDRFNKNTEENKNTSTNENESDDQKTPKRFRRNRQPWKTASKSVE
ncbi:hypothetical protein GWI33_011528 [Rhynchophorus ferrugineus]|uniref:Uncharacterized protein n=1 Tax=Rhynchophorus ferrugineus TaxID=354439 RepID=A0A834IUC8_RHYFE|nr:hypothetical protein GWI33_011528 [Rhynchophorus ferrugineus]